MGSFSQNIRFLRLHFFSRLVLSSQLIFSVVVQDSWYWWSIFSSLQPLTGKVGKGAFPGSLFDIEVSSFNGSMEIINPNYSWKNGVKQIKTTQEKLLQWCFLYSIAKEPNHGVKMRQFFFFFCYHLSYTWVDLTFLTCLTFPKYLWWTTWVFWI